MRTLITTAAVVLAFGAGWLAKTSAQQTAPAPLITYFSHEKVDASFAQAFASTGSRDLFTRKDRQGHSWAAHSNSRGKSDEGQLHSHEDWTGVVVIIDGIVGAPVGRHPRDSLFLSPCRLASSPCPPGRGALARPPLP